MFFLNLLRFNKRITSSDIKRDSRRIRNVVVRLFATTTNPTIGELMEQWTRRFENEGIPEPIESIEHIIAHIRGTSKKLTDLNSHDGHDQKLEPEQYKKLESLCECRLSRMPVQYIIGEWDFRELTLKLVPPVFIPRPETELLVDFVLKRVNHLENKIHTILEIGCGSGAISLALARASDKIKCTGIDQSLSACELAIENRNNLNLNDRLKIIHATLKEEGIIELLGKKTDVGEINLQKFDVIVSNPPYVPTKSILGLAPEIRIYEDLRALDGGEDGLKIIKPLLKFAGKILKPNGRLFMEVDPSHPEYINFFTKKYSDLKLHHEHTYKDYCNNERFVEILKVS